MQAEASAPAILASDEWTLRYINIVRIQPLIEAFDDDASGFITVREANQFTRMRLPDWRFVFLCLSCTAAALMMLHFKRSTVDCILGSR